MTEKDIYNEILSDKENVLFVGMSSYMLNNQKTCDFMSDLTKHQIKVVSGGYGPTFEPEKFLKSGATLVMLGEGEKSIVEVARYFGEENTNYLDINGIAILDENGDMITSNKAEAFNDLNEIPYPIRPFLKTISYRRSTVNVLSSRGCMGACTFCSISAFLSKQASLRWRGRSIDNIIEELLLLKAKGVQTVKFIDDSFIENERDDDWCEEFLNKIKENDINMNFRASIRANKVTEKNIKCLKEAGFFSFSCGIENGSPTALKRMKKQASLSDNETALNIFKKNDIYVQAGFILFDDNTTINELEENFQFLERYIWLVTKGIFSEMYAAEGTQFTKNLQIKNSNKYASNNIYKVKDLKARIVYDALKKWQLHHSKIYDMVIDPISAPKDIPINEMKKYYDLMIEMKKVDLLYMREVLDCVNEDIDVEGVFEKYLQRYNSVFQKIYETVIEYYENDKLNYDAEINGFLTINN